MHLEEAFLDHVVGVVASARGADHEREHVSAMSLEKFEECTFVSRGCTPGERLVRGLDGLVAGGRERVHGIRTFFLGAGKIASGISEVEV